MTEATHVASRREDARSLQAKLYREIGISAVAAALRFTTQPESDLVTPRGVEKPVEKHRQGATRAA